MRILSIDAWAGDEEGTWDWNNWHTVGQAGKEVLDLTNDKLIEFMIEEGFLKQGCEKLVEVEDDGYNIVFSDRETFEPIFAIEYGPELD